MRMSELRSMRVFLHLAMATAIFPIVGIEYLSRSVALSISTAVVVFGALLFGFQSRWVLWIFPAAMAATALWSADWLFTLLSAGSLFVPVVLAGIVVRVSGPVRFINTLAIWARIAVLVSLAAFVFLPEVGAHQDVLYDGALRGIFVHKNGMARILVVGVFAELFSQERAVARWLWLGVYLAAGVLTESLSFFVLSGMFAGAAWVLRKVKWDDRHSSLAWLGIGHIVAAVGVVIAVIYGPEMIDSTGRFSDSEGRGRIWAGVLTAFSVKPLGGWGYGMVFRAETEAGEIIRAASSWTPTAAHNGYLNALAEGGLLGLGALVASLALGMVVTWKSRRHLLWPLAYALVMPLNNLTDTRTSSLELFVFSAGVIYASVAQNAESYPGLPEPDPAPVT